MTSLTTLRRTLLTAHERVQRVLAHLVLTIVYATVVPFGTCFTRRSPVGASTWQPCQDDHPQSYEHQF